MTSRAQVWSFTGRVAIVVALALATPRAATLRAQAAGIRVRDLTIDEMAVPLRLNGYGLVVGLDGTGDRTVGGKEGGMTVNSVVNLLRNFSIEIPPEVLRTRNVAAVLVTAEVSPYLRPGGRFEVHVSSLGDARSIRGGVLWMTPLVFDVGGPQVGSAQGPMLISDSPDERNLSLAVNSARIPDGGLLESDLPRTQFANSKGLLLREPDVALASKIAVAINGELGDGTATVEDPGSIALALKPDKDNDRAALLAKIGDLRVQPARDARLIIDGRDGTIVAGGDITVGEASVSHGGITLTVGAVDTAAAPPGQVRVAAGTPVTRVAAALHAIQATPAQIAAIFEALRSIGAISSEVVIR